MRGSGPRLLGLGCLSLFRRWGRLLGANNFRCCLCHFFDSIHFATHCKTHTITRMMNAIAQHSSFVICLAPNSILVAPPMSQIEAPIASQYFVFVCQSFYAIFRAE